MPPVAVWSELFNKAEVKLNCTEIGWKNLMNECLMGVDIYKKEEDESQECLRLDPNLVMDMRHKMVKEYPKTISLPQAQIYSEALKVLRKNNHDRLLREKEVKKIEKEVAKLKQTLENHRLSAQKQLDETIYKKTTSGKNYTKLWKKLESSEGSYEMDAWLGRSIEILMETKINDRGTPVDVKVSFKRKEVKEELDEDEGKNEIMKRFLKNDETKEDKIYQKTVRRAWTAWKIYTKKYKNRNKIETFLSKLKEREKSKDLKSNQFVKQNDNLKKLMEEVKASKMEACQKLQKITKPQVYPNPKFLQKMEERREERLKRKKELEEKKRKLEEESEKMRKEIEEEKKRAEEDNKRKKIEKLKEKKRVEKEKKLQEELQKQKLKTDTAKAENYYRLYLLRRYGLRPWTNLMKIRDSQLQRAVAYFDERLSQKVLKHWLAEVQIRVGLKRKLANEFWEKMLKKNSLSVWVEFYREKVKQNQVALDWNEFRVTERAFKKWLEFTENEQMLYFERLETARIYHERKLKSKYLKKLQDYPEYKRLERAKENRKRMWREKIREIIPDYQPADVFETF